MSGVLVQRQKSGARVLGPIFTFTQMSVYTHGRYRHPKHALDISTDKAGRETQHEEMDYAARSRGAAAALAHRFDAHEHAELELSHFR